MPVTARLSKKFYDQLGEDIAAELVDWFNQVDATYRSDLREVNELNFARFDAKLEQRLAEFELKLERRFAAFELKVERRFAAFESKVEHRFAAFESKVEHRFAAFEARLTQLEKTVAEGFAAVDGKIATAVGAARDSLLRWMIGLWITQLLAFAGLWMSRG